MKDKSDTNDDILRELDTQGGFRVPAGYFVQLNRNILKQTAGIEDETGSGFTAPEAYFETSRSRILEQTTGPAASKPALKIWYKRAVTRYAAAAVILTGSFLAFYLPGEQKSAAIAQTEITDEDIIEYFEVSDARDIPTTEVSFASVAAEPPVSVTPEEHYIILQTDEQSIIEEL